MHEFFFMAGNTEDARVDLYASVVANDAASAVQTLRAEIAEMIGDSAGIQLSASDDRITRLLIGINAERITEDDIFDMDADDAPQWDGEEISVKSVTSVPPDTEAREASELEAVSAVERFTLAIRQRQNRWEQKRDGGSRSLQFAVAQKGGVSVYGLNRFPVTLYYEQWVKLLDVAGELRRFVESNKANLKKKGR